jgi:hypothetical protein
LVIPKHPVCQHRHPESATDARRARRCKSLKCAGAKNDRRAEDGKAIHKPGIKQRCREAGAAFNKQRRNPVGGKEAQAVLQVAGLNYSNSRIAQDGGNARKRPSYYNPRRCLSR